MNGDLRENVTLVYLLAASHSGSTLTAMLLNAHPDICAVGEMKMTNMGDPNLYRCSCKELLDECLFWNEVKREMTKKGFDLNFQSPRTHYSYFGSAYAQWLLKPLYRGGLLEAIRSVGLKLSPGWWSFEKEMKSRNLALASAISSVANARIVVDSSKVALRLKFLTEIEGLRVRVVRLVRDGRAVALTYMKPAEFADATNPKYRAGGSGGSRVDNDLSISQAAREWLRSNEEAEAICSLIPDCDLLTIKYEELCLDVKGTMGRVYRFLGVQSEHDPANFRQVPHHVIGNGMRMDDSAAIVLDDRWKKKLSRGQLKTFDEIAGQLNRSMGYE